MTTNVWTLVAGVEVAVEAGKLLLEISRRNVWPFLKTLLVDQRSMLSL